MIHAIDSVNKRNDLLPNVVLGYDIRPTCNSEALTLGSMLSLVNTVKSHNMKGVVALKIRKI